MGNVTEALDTLEEAVKALHKSLGGLEGESLDLEGVSNLIDRVDSIKRLVGDCTMVLLPLAQSLRTDQEIVPVESGHAVEYGFTSTRKTWDHAALKSVVAEAILARSMDFETGTLEAPASQLIQEALECVGISYWKVKELKALSIDPDRYCEKPDGTFKATVRR